MGSLEDDFDLWKKNLFTTINSKSNLSNNNIIKK